MGPIIARSFLGLVVAPLVLALAYHEFLGHRSDYLGHYLAGYGGTLLLIVCTLAILPEDISVVHGGPLDDSAGARRPHRFARSSP